MRVPLVEIKGVEKSFKNLKAVKGIDLTIGEGEFLGLLGPNGAGKTTLIEMIEGLQNPDKGSIVIDGKTWAKSTEALHRIIGLSLQETKFMDKLTVRETLHMFASFYNLATSRVNEVMTMVNLEAKHKTYTVQLSGGQRQRLALGVALLHKPRILLLDEPTTGLDPTARREVWHILQTLKRTDNISMILTTHYMEEASFLCDRIVIMDQGSFIAEGTLAALTERYSDGEIIECTLQKQLPEGFEKSLIGMKSIYQDPHTFHVQMVVESISKTLPIFIQELSVWQIPFEALECRRATLDDLFIKMTGRRLHE